MANYKDFIEKPGSFKKNNNKEDSNEKKNTIPKPKVSKDLEEIAKIIDDYIDLLKETLLSDIDQQTLLKFDSLSGTNREDAYRKIYNIYIKYINFPDLKAIMDTNILNTIKNYYNRGERANANKKAPLNKPVIPKKVSNTGSTENKGPTRTRKRTPKDNK